MNIDRFLTCKYNFFCIYDHMLCKNYIYKDLIVQGVLSFSRQTLISYRRKFSEIHLRKFCSKKNTRKYEVIMSLFTGNSSVTN